MTDDNVIDITDGLHQKKRRELINRINETRHELREAKRACYIVKEMLDSGRAHAANNLLNKIIEYTEELDDADLPEL